MTSPAPTRIVRAVNESHANTDRQSPSRNPKWAIYALIVGSLLVAVFFCFYRLSADRLGLDEAHYASATQNLLRPTNDTWLIATPYPGHLYFQKPPAYMWLSSTLVRHWSGELWAFRAWSALFGTCAIVLTAVLGWRISGGSIAIGAMAAAILATNRGFLFHHGARDGTMDTALTLLATLAVFIAVRKSDDDRPVGYGRFIAIGICCGAMAMFKPFAGLPLLPLVVLPLLFGSNAPAWKGKLARFGTALGVTLLVTSPWYIACGLRYGRTFFDDIIGKNVYGRIVEGQVGNVRDVTYYLEVLAGSSLMFLSFPAIGYAIWRVLKGDRRLLPLVVVGAGLPLVFTLSAAKITHYLYPAFPTLCVLIGLFLADMLRQLGDRLNRPELRARLATVFVTLLVAVGAVDLILHTTTQRQPRTAEILATLTPALERGEVDIASTDFPTDVAEWSTRLRLEADDIYWLTRMRDAAERWPAKESITSDESSRPTLLVTNRLNSSPATLANHAELSDPRLRYEDGQVFVGLTNSATLLRPTIDAATTSRYIELVNDGQLIDGMFKLRVRSPLASPMTLHVEYVADGLTADADVRSRARVNHKRVDRGFAYPTAAGRHVTAPIAASEEFVEVTFEISPTPAGGKIVRAWLVVEVE